MMHIFKNAYQETIGHIKAFITAVFVAALSFGALYFCIGQKLAIEELPFAIAPIIGSFVGAAFFYLWNLSCAPFRIERDAHNETKKQLSEIKSQLGKPIDWTVWRGREHFTLREAASILAGTEPVDGPLVGSASVFAQDIRWAIQEGNLNTDISGMEAIKRNTAKALREEIKIPDSEKIRAATFKVWLLDKKGEAAITALRNLEENDLLLVRNDTTT